jgi:hypothetical protein
MTFPLVPNPSIHTDPTAAAAAAGEAQQALQQLQTLFSQVPGEIMIGVVNSILSGLGLSSAEGTVDQFLTQLETAISDLNGAVSGNGTDLESLASILYTWLTGQTLTSTEWSTIESDLNAIPNFIDQVINEIDNAVINAGQIIGAFFPGLFGNVPSTAITSTPANLLLDGGFTSAISLQGGGIWSVNSTIYYPQAGQTSPGSAQVTANGTTLELASNALTVGSSQTDQIVPGQEISYSVEVLTSGLTGTGTPIQMGVKTNLGDTILAQVLPSGSTTGWTNPPSGSLGATLAADYTVPSDGSVTQVQMILVVGSTATAGTVYFSAASEEPSGGLIPTLQADLEQLQNDSTASTAATATFVQAVETAIVDYTSWSSFMTAVESAWNTWVTTESGLASDETFTLQNFFNSLIGINTSTGLINQNNVASSTGGANLASDVSAFNTSISTLVSDLFSAFGATGTASSSALQTQIVDFIENLFGTGSNPASAKVQQSSINGLTTIWNDIFGTTTPASGQQVLQSAIQDLGNAWTALFGSSSAPTTGSQVLQSAVQDLGNAWTALFGSSSAPTTGSQVLQSAVQDLGNAWTALFGSSSTPTTGSQVLQSAVQDLDNAWTAIFGSSSTPTTGSQVQQESVNGLTNVWNWLFGTTTPTSTTQVQASAVTGAGGQTDLGSAVQSGWDQLVQAFTGGNTTGNGLGQLANAAQGTASTANNAQTVAQSATMTQAQQATAKPGYMAIDATMDAVFPLSHMIASPTYVSVTSSAPIMGFIRTSDNISKLSVAWLGSYTGTISTLVITVYAMNITNGQLTEIEASSNIIGSVGTALQWNYYDLASAITVAPGYVYGVQMSITGSGTYSIMGLSNSTFPQNSSVYPKALGASGVAASSIAPTYDATGAGSFTNVATNSFSWSHTIGASASGILIAFMVAGATTSTVSGVEVGSSSATLLGSETVSGELVAYLYELLNPPTGTQTVTVTLSSTNYLIGNSDSYNGVSSFGTVATNSSTSSGSASVSVSSATGQTPVAAIFAPSTSITSFNQTSRWNNGDTYFRGAFGDAAGASTVSFTASTSDDWAAIGVSLISSVSIYAPIYSANVPWFGLGTSASAATPVYSPQTFEYTVGGTYTSSPVPSWANYVDIIAVGSGGPSGSAAGVTSYGSAGSWAATTVTVGSGISVGATLTANVAASSTTNQGATTVTYDNPSSTLETITANSGAYVLGLAGGYGPGNYTYKGVTYFGGASVAIGYPGSFPGGGAGTPYGDTVLAGAAGAVWIVFRQS